MKVAQGYPCEPSIDISSDDEGCKTLQTQLEHSEGDCRLVVRKDGDRETRVDWLGVRPFPRYMAHMISHLYEMAVLNTE